MTKIPFDIGFPPEPLFGDIGPAFRSECTVAIEGINLTGMLFKKPTVRERLMDRRSRSKRRVRP